MLQSQSYGTLRNIGATLPMPNRPKMKFTWMINKRCVWLLLLVGCVAGIFLSRLYIDFYVVDLRTLPIRRFPVLKPNLRCQNVMTNLTNGGWIHWSKFISDSNSEEYKKLEKEERTFDDYMNTFRIKRGIHTKLWRNDLKCGLKNKQTKPKGNEWGGSVGSWCDARSNNPCCSNENDGACGMKCNCPGCIDMRNILHAEFAQWVPTDSRCKWKNYTADEACDVMNRFTEIHIVGDSFVRKMGRVLILTLRNDRNYGIVYKKYNEDRKKLCVADDQLYWTECLLDSGTYKEILVDESPLCGMDLSRFVLHSHYAYDTGTKLLHLVKQLYGKPGSVILLGVGGHLSCRSARTFKTILQPAIEYLNSIEETLYSYQRSANEPLRKSSIRWPLIIFMFPDTPDLLKSPEYRAANGKVPCYKFSDQMIQYLTRVGIPYLDYRKLTSGVHSYDGTHHGIGVNVLKVQILLNYLDSLDWISM